MLQPIAYETLAGPAGLALSLDEVHLYVAEQCQNRILRYTQRPAGVWHASVFYQFSGGFGPSSIVVDKGSGYLYVGRYDFGGAGAAAAGEAMFVSHAMSASGALLSVSAAAGAAAAGSAALQRWLGGRAGYCARM